MRRNEGAKPKLIRFIRENFGRIVERRELEELCKDNGTEWARSLRSLRDDGYVYEYDKSNNTYFFPFPEPTNQPKDSRYISNKLKALVYTRDNSTCQMCGRDVKHDGIGIHIDHIVPLEWGGKTEFDNLQCLCKDCNEGKKNYVASENPLLMEQISYATSCLERLRMYFEFYLNEELDVDRLSVIGRTREWTREVRRLRTKYGMNIEFRPKKKGVREKDCYIYLK